ncbi:hypothetical protein HYU22_02565 [Candidatus Woesearchaeota archaeon]|nr:hypothetical protein [Candidatus Woesearchaeota archaeon]
MSFLKKMLFWRRDDEAEFDKLAEKELQGGQERSLFPDNAPPTGSEEHSLFDEPSPAERPALPGTRPAALPGSKERDLELISSKLDTIKAMLNSLDQRMAHLERSGNTEKKERLW